MNKLLKMTFLVSTGLDLLVLFFVTPLWIKLFALVSLALMMITIKEERRGL
jgi:hypothetical protein